MTHELGMPTPQFIYADYDANPAPWLETLFVYLFGKLPVLPSASYSIFFF